MRHSVSITHLHSDNGTQFRHLGDLGTFPDASGEQLRLLVLLNTIHISASRGQRSNTVECFVHRLKLLWKSGQKSLGDMRGYTLMDFDFLLHCLVTDLNTVLLDPTISGTAPRDFLLGYRSLPTSMTYHDRPRNKVIMQKIYDGYSKVNEVYKNCKKLSPYLWRTKKNGQIKQNVQQNDIVYIKNLDRLGVVQQLADTQLKILYKDSAGHLQRDWLLKDDLRFIVAATPLATQVVPEAVFRESKQVIPRKELK